MRGAAGPGLTERVQGAVRLPRRCLPVAVPRGPSHRAVGRWKLSTSLIQTQALLLPGRWSGEFRHRPASLPGWVREGFLVTAQATEGAQR